MSGSFAANLNRLLHGYRIAEQIVAGRESVIEYTTITKMEHGGGTRLIEAAPKYEGNLFPLEMEYTVYLVKKIMPRCEDAIA